MGSEMCIRDSLETASDVYISRCNKAPFAGSQIHHFKGCKNDLSKKLQERRPLLLTFLKGSKKAKASLREQNPLLYDYFTEVWELRTRHMVKKLPSQYVFQLLPCYQEGCPHPICMSGKPETEYCWYEGGPPLSYPPIPIPDTNRPWGDENCPSCSGHCSGHYLNV